MTRLTPGRRRGANAVEFAMVMPLLLGLVGGIFNYALYFIQRDATYRCAMDGVRDGAMATSANAPGIATASFEAAYKAIGYDPAAAKYDSAIVKLNGEDAVSLTVAAPYQSPFGLAIATVPTTVTFTLSMRLEEQPKP